MSREYPLAERENPYPKNRGKLGRMYSCLKLYVPRLTATAEQVPQMGKFSYTGGWKT